MSIYAVGVAVGDKRCGYLSGVVKIKGITFILKNNMFLGQNFYLSDKIVIDNDFFEDTSTGLVFQWAPYIPKYIDSYHDLQSNDIDYHIEVKKLKDIFVCNPLSTFKACKVNAVYPKKIPGTLATEPIIYPVYIFDFEDIFNPISSYSHSPGMWRYSRYFENYQRLGFYDEYFNNSNFDYLSCLISGSHYNNSNFSNPNDQLGTPIGNGNIVNNRSEFLIFDNSYYIFKPNKFPIFDGTRALLSWDVYKIPFKKCCIAECFGITE